jgi:glycosyltransferase involved in cell wall biosynthesis
MKLLIGIPVYKRPKIVQVQLSYTLDVLVPHIENKGVSVDVLIVGSDKVDAEIMLSFPLVKYISIPNVLSDKFNVLVNHAQDHDFDYLMTLGSDDLMPPNLFDAVFDMARENGYIASPCQTWMFDIGCGDIFKWNGYSADRTLHKKYGLGAGRIYTKQSLSKLSRYPFGKGLMKGMESAIAGELESMPIPKMELTSFVDSEDFLFALKSNDNIWKIDAYFNTHLEKKYNLSNKFFDWIPTNIKDKIVSLGNDI